MARNELHVANSSPRNIEFAPRMTGSSFRQSRFLECLYNAVRPIKTRSVSTAMLR